MISCPCYRQAGAKLADSSNNRQRVLLTISSTRLILITTWYRLILQCSETPQSLQFIHNLLLMLITLTSLPAPQARPLLPQHQKPIVLACSWNIVVLSIAIEALVRCPAKVSRTLIGVAGPSRSPRIASSAFQPSCLRVLVRMGVDRACQALYGLTVPAWSTFPVVPV